MWAARLPYDKQPSGSGKDKAGCLLATFALLVSAYFTLALIVWGVRVVFSL